MWGFKNRATEIIWYVGKATPGKGVYARLRKHYLDIMSGQYEIPFGYLNGSFIDEGCSRSGWKIKYANAEIAAVLNNWSQMERIFRAGHSFANEAFARVAFLKVSDIQLKIIEQQAINSLQPVVNKRRSTPLSSVVVAYKEADEDEGWMEHWQQHKST